MRGLIRASMMNPWAVTVFSLTIVLLGTISLYLIPIDILPTFKSPAVQVLTFYSGMPPKRRREGHHQPDGALDGHGGRTGQPGVAVDPRRQHRPQLFPAGHLRRRGALVGATRWSQSVIPYLPPGTLPPVVMPFDPTSMTPACLVALNSGRA